MGVSSCRAGHVVMRIRDRWRCSDGASKKQIQSRRWTSNARISSDSNKTYNRTVSLWRQRLMNVHSNWTHTYPRLFSHLALFGSFHPAAPSDQTLGACYCRCKHLWLRGTDVHRPGCCSVVRQTLRYHVCTMNRKGQGDRVEEEAAFLSRCAGNCSPGLGLPINFIMRHFFFLSFFFLKDPILFSLPDTPSVGIRCGFDSVWRLGLIT